MLRHPSRRLHFGARLPPQEAGADEARCGQAPTLQLSVVCLPLWSGPASLAPTPGSHPLPELHSERLLLAATPGADQPHS